MKEAGRSTENMRKTNPFTLSFGKQPTEYIARHENTEEVVSTFDADSSVTQAYLIEGVRGSGKTVLMTAISNELRNREEWIVVDLLATQNLLDGLAIGLTEECRLIGNLLPSGINISVAGISVGMSGNTKPQNSIVIIDRIMKAIQKKGKKVLVTIDEVVPGQYVRDFAGEFQILIRKDYPLFLLMTGLYENIYSIQNDPSLTFLLRTPKIHMEPLSMYQISIQYESIFGLDQDEATAMAHLTKGYAFAFQALGVLFYERKEGETVEDILPKLDSLLDDFVYRKIWESLSEKDKTIVKAMPPDPIKTKDIAEASGMKGSVFSKYRDRLIRKGVLISSTYGQVEFALPRFYEIIRRY